MSYIVTQKDIELLMQSDKTLYYKLELLNEDMKVLDCIEGHLISDQLSIDSSSDIRRTYTCNLFVENSTFDIGYGKHIFFDRLIKPHIGILHQRSGNILWYPLGLFLFVDANYSYDSSNNSLSLTCNDMMVLLNGIRGGNLDSYKRSIKAGTYARNLIIEILKEVGITKYLIEFNINNKILSDFEIPYDLSYNTGVTAYQIIKEIIELYAGTQCYFSLDGTFIISSIPTSENEQAVLNDDILHPILISEQRSTNFSETYNDIEIWGRVQEPQYYSKNITYSDGVYYCSAISYEFNEETNEYEEVQYGSEIDNFDTFSFKIPQTNITDKTYLNINNTGNILVVKDDGNNIKKNELNSNIDYVFRYCKENNTFLFLGQYQAHARLYISDNESNNDPNAIIDIDNEFSIEKIGHKLKVLSDNSVSNITSDELCKQRCKYELYYSTNKNINLNLQTICIPWLDVNQIIEFTSNSNNQTEKYIINNISCNYSEHTMNIGASKYLTSYI